MRRLFARLRSVTHRSPSLRTVNASAKPLACSQNPCNTCSCQPRHITQAQSTTATTCGAMRAEAYARRQRLRNSMRSTDRVSLLVVFCMAAASLFDAVVIERIALLTLFVCMARIVVLRCASARLEA